MTENERPLSGTLASVGFGAPPMFKPVLGQYALSQLPSRKPVEITDQYWSRKKVGLETSTKFFQDAYKKDINRDTNIEAPGVIPVRRVIMVGNAVLKFARGSKLSLIDEFLDKVIVVYKRYEDGYTHRFIHFERIDDYNYIVPLKNINSFIGAGQLFYIETCFNETLSNELDLTICLNVTQERFVD